MILYRPVGSKELALIAAADFCVFPPRLPEQPIFYPVLNFAYAEQIARDWNSQEPPYTGYVTRFEVDSEYLAQFEVHTVGAGLHQELWVPADELITFNQHIQGEIEVIATFQRGKWVGEDIENSI